MGSYSNENIYNTNESMLFWKMTMDVTFDAGQIARKKHDKVWIIINFACNVIRIHKFELWFISKVIVFYYFG